MNEEKNIFPEGYPERSDHIEYISEEETQDNLYKNLSEKESDIMDKINTNAEEAKKNKTVTPTYAIPVDYWEVDNQIFWDKAEVTFKPTINLQEIDIDEFTDIEAIKDKVSELKAEQTNIMNHYNISNPILKILDHYNDIQNMINDLEKKWHEIW